LCAFAPQLWGGEQSGHPSLPPLTMPLLLSEHLRVMVIMLLFVAEIKAKEVSLPLCDFSSSRTETPFKPVLFQEFLKGKNIRPTESLPDQSNPRFSLSFSVNHSNPTLFDLGLKTSIGESLASIVDFYHKFCVPLFFNF